MTEAAPVRQSIQGYGRGGFTVSGRRYEGSVLILPFRTLTWAAPFEAVALHVADLDPLLDELRAVPDGVEILLIGWGRQAPPPPAILEPLRARLRPCGVSLDGMDTGAACRTFNLLLAENRRVAALLMAVD